MGYAEEIKDAIEKAKEQVQQTGTPASVEIMENDRWVLQLLVTPPSTRQYGAVTVPRGEGVLLNIRSKVNWRNNITIPDARALDALKEILEEFYSNEELKVAVLANITGKVKAVTRPTIKIGQ